MKRLIYLLSSLLVFVLASCAKDAQQIRNQEAVLQFANSVNGESVFPWIEQLADIHLNDIPINNQGFPPKELFPSDHLTRNAAIGFIVNAFTEIGYLADTVTLSGDSLVAYNVVAEHRGIIKPDEVILVAGHLDAFYAGADDNCTSIASILEIARSVKNFSFARTIRFVAFDLEEFGSIGSTRYVEAGYADDVKSAIVIDLIGYASTEPGSQKNIIGLKLPDVGNFLFAIGNKNSSEITQQVVQLANSSDLTNIVGIIAPNDGTYFLSSFFMRSDHGLIWYKGKPAIFFTDGANFRNPHYHLPSDLPETLNKEFLLANTRLIAATVAILAEIQP